MDTKNNKDSYRINYARIKNNTLILLLSYGGGCKKHDFNMVWSGKYLESKPQQVYLHLYHNANNDTCEAEINTTLYFDLTKLLPCIIVINGYDNYKARIRYRLN